MFDETYIDCGQANIMSTVIHGRNLLLRQLELMDNVQVSPADSSICIL